MSYRGKSKGCYGNVRKLQRVHAKRSKRAKRIDESLRAPIAKTPEQWLAQPNRFDFPEVDTLKEANDDLKKQTENESIAQVI